MIGDIQFHNISYKSDRLISSELNGLNILINTGSSVAFVGKIGSGVELPIPLLLRMYACNSGIIVSITVQNCFPAGVYFRVLDLEWNKYSRYRSGFIL